MAFIGGKEAMEQALLSQLVNSLVRQDLVSHVL
jgi:hypothetical protein